MTNTPKETANQRTDFKTGVTLKELELDMSDDELKGVIKNWLSIAGQSDNILITNGKINKDYYRGRDSRTTDIMDDKSKAVDNRIFTDIETIVPIVTSSPAKPVVFIPGAQGTDKKEKEARRDQAIQTQKLLLALYEEQKLQRKFEKVVRQHQIYRIAMIKYGIKDDKIFTEAILPSRLLIDSEATCQEDSEFTGEKIVSTAKALIERFPDKKKEISDKVQGKLGTKITYIEWWSNDFVVTSIDSDTILDKKKNPLFDYTGETEETYDEFGEKMEVTTKFNVFNKPRKPYIRFTVYNIGENIIDDTTPLEQSKSLQDNINDRKRQIGDNASTVGNPIRQYKGFTSEQAAVANENLRAGDGVNLGDDQEISYVQAAPLPAHVQNDLTDSRNSIDNVFGIHSTTKGERQGGESGRARDALREGDEDRQATIGRAIEDVSEELYNAYLHLIKVFYDKPQLIPVIGKEDAGEFLEAKREDVADGIKIIVKPGSTIPDDPNALKAQGLELAQLNRITNRRLYEMLGFDDVEEAVKELEVEGAKAEKKQQKILQDEANVAANAEATAGFQEQIQGLT